MADPTVGDVYNQLIIVNSTLNDISTNSLGMANAFTKVDGDLKSCCTQTNNMLKIIAQIDLASVKLLYHLTQQTDAMICELEHISKNTCEILNQETIQTDLLTHIRKDIAEIEDIEAASHPETVVLRHKLSELREAIDHCCPPPKPEPPCSYEPCPKPEPIRPPDLPKIPPPSDSNNPATRG